MTTTRRTPSLAQRPQPEVIDGRRIWTCGGCSARAEWDDGWRWHGYYKIEGHGSSAGEREVVERVLCPVCFRKSGERAL